jgi:hypothetical protein
MATQKHHVPTHQAAVSESLVWVMIAVILAISCYAVVALLSKVAG